LKQTRQQQQIQTMPHILTFIKRGKRSAMPLLESTRPDAALCAGEMDKSAANTYCFEEANNINKYFCSHTTTDQDT
jgi:hypothetical protein